MYKLPKIYNSEPIPLPTCMYKLPSEKTDYTDTKVVEDRQSCDELKELEEKQKKILEQLHQLKANVDDMFDRKVLNASSCIPENREGNLNEKLRIPIHDIVIYASPDHPPLSLLIVKQLLAMETSIMVSRYTHSSLQRPLNAFIDSFLMEDEQKARKQLTRLENKLAISLIWKDVGIDPILMVNPLAQCPITGELNILRYLFRLLKNSRYYNESDAIQATKIDCLLEDIHSSMYHGNSKQQNRLLQQLHQSLANQPFLLGEQWTMVDVLLWSSLKLSKREVSAPANVKTWLENCSNIEFFQGAMKNIPVH